MGDTYFENLELWMGSSSRIQLEEVEVYKIEFEEGDVREEGLERIDEEHDMSMMSVASNVSQTEIPRSTKIQEKPVQ